MRNWNRHRAQVQSETEAFLICVEDYTHSESISDSYFFPHNY